MFLSSIFFAKSLHSQCLDEGHSINVNDSWLSCQTTVIPSSQEMTKHHWIYYDLGYTYSLGTVKIWNYNVVNETGKGIKDGEIFYANHAENWLSGGTFQIPEATGQNDYIGWENIDLKGINARFILIVAYTNWNNETCTGLSEVRFNIAEQTTSIQQRKIASSEFLISPNPVNQVLSIHLKGNRKIQELVILNSAGHEIKRLLAQNSKVFLDVASYPSGMYFLKARTIDNEYMSSKFVKAD